MAEAFKRLAQEYPWRRDGLSLSERRLLASTPGTKYELFGRAWRKETRPFMGDTFAFAALDRLAPLLRRRRRRRCASTTRGERVLARRGASSSPSAGSAASTSRPRRRWRWDDARETITT